MGSKSRTKGKAAELEVRNKLREYGPFPNADRNLDQVRGDDDSGRDIIGTPDFVIQVKRRARVTQSVIEAGLAEATASTTPADPFAVCIHRSDRQPWRVTMDFYDWLKLVWRMTQ
jgi:hypothetical protein